MPFLSIDRDSPEPLTRQIFDRLRDLILSGAMPSGTRVPSSRRTAWELGVSRNIVMNAFDQLIAEGYLEARMGAGSFVAAGAFFRPAAMPDVPALRRGFRPYRSDRIDFRSGLPDLGRFPVRTWQKLSREVWEKLTPLDLSYSQPEGRAELRGEISRYVAAYRGVRCHPEQIVVTAGTTQAVGIISRLLLEGGGKGSRRKYGSPRADCVLEDPITSDIQRIVASAGWRIVPAPVDSQGMRPGAVPRGIRPGFLYVTPSHQFPTGATMPIQRRVLLLEYARSRGAYVIEDDYDSEFRFDSPPINSIQGLDPSRVVYIGTVSKTLCPAMRIGYAVLPPELVDKGREVKWFTDLHNASVDQLILSRFIKEGHYARYVHAMKKVYRARRAALADSLRRHFGGAAEILGSPAGLHLCARFRGVRFTRDLVAKLEHDGILVYPVEEHAIRKGRWQDSLIMGYGMLSERRMEEGIAILGRRIRGS